MAELVPYPFVRLLRRMFRELESRDSIFDLPRKKFWCGDAAHDLGVYFHGMRASTPLGPAAGPQSQLAQNIVLAWLGGSRIIELKTVQILDELQIPRPCIDMRNIGYNVEWSQELKLEQSLKEYVKASMLIEILQASGVLSLQSGATDIIFDMSVGYDLQGIRSERVRTFVDGMMDATVLVEQLRSEIPAEFAQYRDIPFRTALSRSLTLSTFHGCPPKEIEKIIDYLLREVGLHCVIKLNPTLLGPRQLRRLFNEQMGYANIRVPDSAFENDAHWEQAVAFIDRLSSTAKERNLGLGVKFSNTLIVEHDGEFLPASEKQKYLSGAPLHVLAMNLVQRLREHFGSRIPISFSAGIDRGNFANAVALGLVPITVCSDLLKPGGYARQITYMAELAKRMDAVQAGNVDDYILTAFGNAEAGWQAAGQPMCGFVEAMQAADRRQNVGDEIYDSWVQETARLNTAAYVESATVDPRYHSDKNSRLPKKVGSDLELFNCLTCDKCIPVCPNDANFALVLPPREISVQKLTAEGDSWKLESFDTLKLDTKHQIANFADFCNECGNCDIFCPEDGGPYVLKPRFFGSLSEWKRYADYDGFYLERDAAWQSVQGRFGKREFRMVCYGEHVEFSGHGFVVEFERNDIVNTCRGHTQTPIDLTYFHIMDLLREAVYESNDVNYANA